ncbi:hypothetical protein PV726_07495 [Streptomyces europaeiscabiei]|uniref:hypothetical protein n=1 Tax=Streptomyces europaeiscabiei TaxID=146819 RepID=UPI0029BD5E54|nr:hypothetical protein [Streptomyces europaeiscabiei]MDX3690173.1 hypothetical protein [Streptomyces europaeiscabiei]
MRYVIPGRDRATGYTELRCPEGYFLSGDGVRGGDVAQGHCKGPCADHECAAGIACTARVGSSARPTRRTAEG